MCKSRRVELFLELGSMPPADAFLRADQLREPETHYPLDVHLCLDCGLAQLGYVVSPEILYRRDYPYEASITMTGQRHWAELAASAAERFAFPAGALAVDVGSNVGILLEQFRNHGFRVLGVDPASNIVRIAERRGIETIDELFSRTVAKQIRESHGPAAVVTATNVFAHMDDLDGFVEAIDLLLQEDGVLIIEAPSMLHLVQSCEYDTIYHEHLSYISVGPTRSFFASAGFEVFDVEERDIHGGSIRIFIGRRGSREVASRVAQTVAAEEAGGIRDPVRLRQFAADVARNRIELTNLLQDVRRSGKRVAGVGAPAKGMTLLNYCRIGPETLEFVTEKSQLKIGRFTPGTHIPVRPDRDLITQQIDCGLLLAWNFADEIMANLSEFRARGGTFIIPIPRPRLIQ
jgi:SAM-dependent methyltransferase